MTFVPIARVLCRAGMGCVVMMACSCILNPQPLPPGDSSDGGRNAAAPASGSAADASARAVDGASADSPAPLLADAGVAASESGDGGTGAADGPTDADAGTPERGDGGTGAADGPTDGGTGAWLDGDRDRLTDALDDGEEDGG